MVFFFNKVKTNIEGGAPAAAVIFRKTNTRFATLGASSDLQFC